jgi:phosphoribosylamine--glycine ligase
MEACIEGRLANVEISWDSRAAVCVVMASQGYPGSYERGKRIHGLEQAGKIEGVYVFHAGTVVESGNNGHYLTAGGRVLGVTGMGKGIKEAIELAYRAVAAITWEGAHFRKDIGKKALAWIKE